MAVSGGSPGRLQPADRRRLTDHAHEAIRGALLAGEFAMGERLIETELAADLQMSRAPIRESLRRLAKEGLVVEHPNRGVTVVEISAGDVVDLYNLRLGIEVVALRLFMLHGSSVEPLRALVDKMLKAARRGRSAEVVRAELEFHRAIAAGSGNALLLASFEQIEGRMLMVLAMDDAAFANLEEVADEHVPIIEAIEHGDEEHAAQVFEEHLVSTVGAVLDRLGGTDTPLLRPRRPRARRRRRD